MIRQETVYICDLCGEKTSPGQCYRVQHCIDNSNLKNPKAAGIELYQVAETIAFNAASQTLICFDCCATIVKKVKSQSRVKICLSPLIGNGQKQE